jgi:cobalamin biosynthesis protein CobD/CbiB
VLASSLGITLTPKSFLRNGKVIFITVGDDRREPHFDDPETAAAVMFSAVSFTMLLFFALKLLFIILVG